MTQLLEIFGVKRTEKQEVRVEVLPKFESKKVTSEMIEISTKQAKDYEKAMEYIESVADCTGRIKEVRRIASNRLTNWTVQFADDEKYVHVVDTITGYKYGTFSLGNKKLCKNEKIQFILFNLLQVVTCPNATEGCLKFCYANKSNNNIKVKNSASRISRTKNTVLSMYANFEEIVTEVIKLVESSTNKSTVFRWHESGDIYSKEYFEKMINIMSKNSSVQFMFYTKTIFTLSKINEINNMKNVSMRYSLDDTSSAKIVQRVHEENILNTIVIQEQELSQVVKEFDNSMVCNFNGTQQERDSIVATIEEKQQELAKEHRKTYQRKIQTDINGLQKSLLNKNQKCHSCMKCHNKQRNTIMFGAH
jgi:hypothetical protein